MAKNMFSVFCFDKHDREKFQDFVLFFLFHFLKNLVLSNSIFAGQFFLSSK